MPERVKKQEGQMGNVLYGLEKISGSLTKLDKMGYDLAKIAEVLCKQADSEGNQGVAKPKRLENSSIYLHRPRNLIATSPR